MYTIVKWALVKRCYLSFLVLSEFCVRWLKLQSVTKLLRHRVTSENKRIHTPPLHSRLRCLLFSIGSSDSSTTLYGGDGGGKALFFPFEVREKSESPFRAIASQIIFDFRSKHTVPISFHPRAFVRNLSFFPPQVPLIAASRFIQISFRGT